jgi:hypothetical protein
MATQEDLTMKSKERRWHTEALDVQNTPDSVFSSPQIRSQAYFADPSTIILKNDAGEAAKILAAAGVHADCIVTSPPFYGQRDYKEKGQIVVLRIPPVAAPGLVFRTGRRL